MEDIQHIRSIQKEIESEVTKALKQTGKIPPPLEFANGAYKMQSKSIPGFDNIEDPEEQQKLLNIIGGKLESGKAIVTDIFDNPDALDEKEVTREAVADVAWYLRSVAESKVGAFVKGAMTVPDPGGKLKAYLDKCEEKYARGSSHMKGEQKKEGNMGRGIDFYDGAEDPNHLLPYGMNTFLFQAFTTAEGEERLFIKTETESARVSAAMFSMRSDKPESRPISIREDIPRSIKHGINLIHAMRGKHDDQGGAAYRERMPKEIAKRYKALLLICKHDKVVKKLLEEGLYDKEVFQMLQNIQSVVTEFPRLPDYIQDGLMDVLDVINSFDWDANTLASRVGGEIVITKKDLVGEDSKELAQVEDYARQKLKGRNDFDFDAVVKLVQEKAALSNAKAGMKLVDELLSSKPRADVKAMKFNPEVDQMQDLEEVLANMSEKLDDSLVELDETEDELAILDKSID